MCAEAHVHLVAGDVVGQYQSGHAGQSAARLVGGHVSASANAQHQDVDAAVCLNLFFVGAAVFCHHVLCDGAVEAKHVFRLHVYLIEKQLVQFYQTAVLRAFVQWKIFVGVEHHNVSEAESSLVAAY